MDNKIKKCCPNCSQLYRLKCKTTSTKSVANIPLFLECGHSICENCIRNIVKFTEPIECKICHQEMQIDVLDNESSLYKLFPINVYMIGELTLEDIEQTTSKTEKVDNEYHIDIKALIKNPETIGGQCLECNGPTSKMCQQCGYIVCNSCFNKTHKNFVIFKDHVLQEIELTQQKNTCKTHQAKTLDYYCKDCRKSICMDCLVVGGEKSCKNHDVTSMQDVNENFLTDIAEMTPKVDETLRRLTKTSVDIGNLLTKIDDELTTCEYTALLNNIDQHFSQLNAIIQKQKNEITDKVIKLKNDEKQSLQEAKIYTTDAIKRAINTLNIIKILDPNKLKELNMALLLEDVKKVIADSWYLSRDKSEDTLKLTVKEDLLSLLNDYIKLDGNANPVYKLLSSNELTEKNKDIPIAPASIVYPPKVTKDVRQINKPKPKEESVKPQTFIKNIPQYRSNKGGSCSSLNSINSDSGHKSYLSYEQHRPLVEQVPPFPDSQHPKQLFEGSQELIYISHIVDPHNLFVQRVCQQDKVEELIREFRTAVSLPKPSINHVSEGKVYLVYNKADNLWQRCRIVSIDRKDINKPLFYVFCVDFGSTEVVHIDKLRLLPPARIQSPPPFAIHCALANCEPINGTWTNDDSFLVQSIIDNKRAVIYIRRIRSTANGSVSLECDITTFEDGVSLAHALAFHGRARIPHKLSYPRMMGISERPKLFMNSNDYKRNCVEEVYITHIVNPDNFCVRKSHCQRVYESMCEDLDQEYSLDTNTGSVYLPQKGMFCAANIGNCGLGSEVAGGWARAVVRELPGRGRVQLLLPDTGAHVVVHWTALRRIHAKFTTTSALATECHLAGVTPLNKKWSPRAVALLKEFKERCLELHVEDSRNRGSVGVTLYDRSDEDNVVCINTEMIRHKFAITFGLYMFNKNIDMDELVVTNKTPLDNPQTKPKTKDKNNITILSKTSSPQISKEEDSAAIDKGPLRLEAKILNYQSPSLIHVSLVHQQKVFNEMFEKIQKYYSKKKTAGKEDWKVGDRCCTICNQSQTWRRAAILEIEGDNAKLFYSDFACVETVPTRELRELAEEFASVGDAVIMCHLCGVIPAAGEEWPSLTKEYLKELIDAYKRFFITKHGQFKGKSMPIELWVYHIIQGGALEPNTSEWRCLNNKIIEQGLGIPDKSEEACGSETTTTSTRDDMLSFLNITGSVRDWLQIEPMPMKPLKIKPISENDSKASTPVDVEEKEDFKDSNTVFISDWLPPEPLPSNEFIAMPTYIDNDGVIYLHDVSQQDTLDLIRKALDVRFKNPDPKAKFVKWTVGEPCVALYFLDNRFYRGKVLEVNNENSSCLIHYIDYGNEETCSFENLRKSIALYQIPIQAHKCILNRIRPTGKNWNRQTLDYIHKSIVEKQCYVKVSGEPIGDLTPVELKYDKLWINDHLVDFEMATYSDGTKAVVAKFAPQRTKDDQKIEEPLGSDSGPDYLVEYDDHVDKLSESQCLDLISKDWNEIIEDECEDIAGNFITFQPYTKMEFLCTINSLNERNKFELSVVLDDETTAIYEEMYTQLRSQHNNTPLKGIYENKACIALFPEDEQWYRASILQYSGDKGLIKVKYVDYGNIEVISLAETREISEEFVKLPPATITATLHGIEFNPDIDEKAIVEKYTDTFIDKDPFHVKIIKSDVIPSVELRDSDGKLIYEKLLEENIFIKND